MFKKLNLFSKTEWKLLSFISQRDGELYERQIAEESGVSAGSANSILKSFERMDIVKKSRSGRMLFYQRNDDNPMVRQLKVVMTMNDIMPVIEKLSTLSRRITLFGSCAQGTNTEASDIDLFVLSDEKSQIRRILDSYPKIQVIILTAQEYAELEKKDKPLYERINRGIELYGGRNG
ncbi:MAG: nucleotidyltransferase domain-containing protein [Candidatus Micrarchaeota archaeon]